jgi:hypothetical protein
MRVIYTFLISLFFCSITFTQPFYVAGSHQGWVNNSDQMNDNGINGDVTASDGIYSLEMSIAAVDRYEWKVTDGTWNNTWPTSNNNWFNTSAINQTVLFTFDTNLIGDGWAPDPNTTNVNVTPTTIVAVGNFQDEEGEVGDWTNNSTVTAMYDNGTNGDWASGDGVYCYHATSLPAGSYEYKAVQSGSWDSWGTDGRNINGISWQFTTTTANQDVYLYVNVNTGRIIVALDDPLPVELTSFTANTVEDGVLLEWETATEVNNYGFEVERKNDGMDEWLNVGFVQGHGNSNSPKKYEYLDADAPAGDLTYRLKQIDTDGSFEYFNTTAAVSNNITSLESDFVPAEYSLKQNFPNPFNPTTQISFTVENREQVSLKVYDMLGNEIAQLFNGSAEPGRLYNIDFDAANLSSGIYLYRLQSNNFVDTRKMTVLK